MNAIGADEVFRDEITDVNPGSSIRTPRAGATCLSAVCSLPYVIPCILWYLETLLARTLSPK